MPGILDDFINAFKGDPKATARVASSAANYVKYVDAGPRLLMRKALLPWFEQVSARVPEVWYDPEVQRVCDHTERRKSCRAKAVGMCSVCNRDVCLTHAFIGLDATLVCASCVKIAEKHVEPVENHVPTPQAQNVELEVAYELLGLRANCDDEVLERAYKAQLKKYHPDKASDDKKSEHEAKFKAIRSAYDTILKARAKH